MRLSVTVQHHPSRAHLLDGLDALGDHSVTVDPDPDGPRSAIRTYMECLRDLDGATHRLVVQDDAAPCPGFRALAEQAIREQPDTLVAFFVPGTGLHARVMREAARTGARWAELPRTANWVPVVALSWPVDLAARFVPYAEQHVADRRRRGMNTVGDDPVVGKFRRDEKLRVWATVPCLVEHPDLAPSLVRGRHYEGHHPARRAAVTPSG